jgi:hypothetical protein
MSYQRVEKCRVCNNTNLVDIVDLGNHALAGVFPQSIDQEVPKMPLVLTKCHGLPYCCHLLQLAHTFDLTQMYGDNYGYRSGLNAHIVNHLQQKVERLLSLVDIDSTDLILDIGSNDGTTLSFYPNSIKLRVGIDPSATKFAEYYPKQVKFIPDFFKGSLFRNKYGDKKAKVITSYAMFYDLPDPVSFARDVAFILDEQGIWELEQSYMPAMLDQVSYDTICHEHLEYYGMRQIKWIMDQVDLDIIDVEFNSMNGGSFSVTVAHKGFSGPRWYEKVADVLHSEARYQFLEPFQFFACQIEEAKNTLVTALEDLKKAGKTVAALGASTKGNVILQYCQLDVSLIKVIGEINEDKFGKYTPGTFIPILPEDAVLAENPDYLLVLPWHLKTFFDTTNKYSPYSLVYPI